MQLQANLGWNCFTEPIFSYSPTLPMSLALSLLLHTSLKRSTNLAKDRHVIAKTRQATQANRRHRHEPDYQVGDLVSLNTGNLPLKIKQKDPSVKFFPRFIGPFPILEARPETSSYKLDLPAMNQIHPVLHDTLLRPAMPNDPE